MGIYVKFKLETKPVGLVRAKQKSWNANEIKEIRIGNASVSFAREDNKFHYGTKTKTKAWKKMQAKIADAHKLKGSKPTKRI